MNRLRHSINNRLVLLNQRSFAENIPQSTVIYIALGIVGTAYFIVAISLFHTLWYHKLFALASAFAFAYSALDLYFEMLETKVKQALPKTIKKLSHYYSHFKGNVIPAMMEAEEKCPQEAKLYLNKIRKALISGMPKEEIEVLKGSFPFVWFRMLASLLLMAKEKGTGVQTEGTEKSMIGRSLAKITNILSFINVQQGYNDAELKYIQFFLYLAPFLFIFASDWINAKILIEMNMQEVYKGIKAQNMKTCIFVASNLSALFIHWMRKQQL